ncbi:MAG: hypothetical protein GWP14_02555 [Actinobacteria bacterium]|nr:hypothetical protein [Actinomycetota bacterium]
MPSIVNTGNELAAVCKRLAELGMANANGGNVSIRLAEGRYLATPTGMCLRDVSAADLVTVDATGTKVDGPGEPTMEVKSHLSLYQQRPDLNAVIHCHPPAALTWALAGKLPPLEAYCEGYFLVGKVELIEPYQTPPELPTVIKSKTENTNGFLLVNHGLMMAGSDLRTALLRVEDYELLCRAALDAEAIGGAKPIDPSKLAWLAELHGKTFPR